MEILKFTELRKPSPKWSCLCNPVKTRPQNQNPSPSFQLTVPTPKSLSNYGVPTTCQELVQKQVCLPSNKQENMTCLFSEPGLGWGGCGKGQKKQTNNLISASTKCYKEKQKNLRVKEQQPQAVSVKSSAERTQSRHLVL